MNTYSRWHRATAWLLPAGLLAFLLLTSVTEPLPNVGVYDGKRLLFLAVMAIGLLLPLTDGAYRREFAGPLGYLPAWCGLALLLAFGLGMVSALAHPPSAYPLVEVGQLLLLPLGVLGLAASRRTLGNAMDRVALVTIAVLFAAITLQELMGFLAGRATGTPHSFTTMGLYFAHPRFYNHLQTWLMPVLAALPWVFSRRRPLVVLVLGLLALQWALLFLSGGRGSLLALLLTHGLAAAALWRHRPGWLGVQAAALVLGAGLFWFPWGGNGDEAPNTDGSPTSMAVQQSLDRITSGHSSGRTTLWRVAWEAGRDEPWLGLGPGRYACIAPQGMGNHPHSFPLQLWAEWGAPATVLMALIAGWLALAALRSAWRGRLDPGSTLQQALTISLLAAAVHAAFSGVLMAPASQAAAVLVGGWLIGHSCLPSRPAGPVRLSSVLAATAAALALWMALFAMMESQRLHAGAWPGSASETLSPRFWQLGNVCSYPKND